jgi:hypothetical protein
VRSDSTQSLRYQQKKSFRACSLAAILKSAKPWGSCLWVSAAIHWHRVLFASRGKTVKLKGANTLAEVDAVNLTVFAHQEAFDAKQALPRSSSPVTDLGKSGALHSLFVPSDRQPGTVESRCGHGQVCRRHGHAWGWKVGVRLLCHVETDQGEEARAAF